MIRLMVAFVAGFFLVACCGQEYETEVRPLTDDGAWCWFADPRAVHYEGDRPGAYVGWVNRSGDIVAAACDRETGEIETFCLHEGLQADDHCSPALLFLEDGRLMIFYSRHSRGPMYYRVTKSPSDISSWGDERTVDTNTVGPQGVTYPYPVRLSGEDNAIYLFWRGGDFKPAWSKTRNGVVWSEARTLIRAEAPESYRARPYLKVADDGRETIHFAFTDGHPRREVSNGIYYAQYRAGVFYRADGSRIKAFSEAPIHHEESDRVYNGKAGRAWIWDVAFDGNGGPVIVYSQMPSETDHRYVYARWNGKAWENFEITSAGGWFPQTPEGAEESETYYSGGVVLDHSDPSIVYLSRPVEGVFEIERWETSDGGRNWRSEAVTSGSERNNIRPVVPRNSKPAGVEVIWMTGGYRHYTDYETGLMMSVAKAE